MSTNNQVTFPNPYTIGGITFSYKSIERVDMNDDDFSNIMFVNCVILATNDEKKFPLGAYAHEISILYEMTVTIEVNDTNGPIHGHRMIVDAKPF